MCCRTRPGRNLADGEATGTIENSDLMPQAWIARFGRTVAEQVLEAVEERIRSAPQAGVQVTVAGQRIGAAAAPSEEEAREAEAQARLEDFSTWLRGEACRDDPGAGGDCPARTRSREVTPRDLLTGSSFALTTGADGIGGGLVSLWGRGALTRFDGREGDLSLSGEVTGALLGADWTRERWTTGLMLSHARGEGSYRGADSGKVSSTVTGLYPYGRYAVTDRVTVWGAAGYGVGTLTLTPGGRRVDVRGQHGPRHGGGGAARGGGRGAGRRRAGACGEDRRDGGPDLLGSDRRQRGRQSRGGGSGRDASSGSGWRGRGGAWRSARARWCRVSRWACAMTAATPRPGSGSTSAAGLPGRTREPGSGRR